MIWNNLNKPKIGTEEQWDTWERETKSKYPITWFFKETVPTYLGRMWYKIDDIIWYFKCLYRDSHRLKSSFKKGTYQDFDTLILDNLFTTLVYFVEVELAHKHCICDSEAAKKYGFKRPLFGKFKSKEAGLAHLEWEMTLIEEGEPTVQAFHASEKYMLYDWWVNHRPNRKPPMELSGWNALYEEHDNNSLGQPWVSFHKRNQEEQERISKILDTTRIIEQQYDTEDEEMLIRLIKIRNSLWV